MNPFIGSALIASTSGRDRFLWSDAFLLAGNVIFQLSHLVETKADAEPSTLKPPWKSWL
jgi:hypothetical protein